MKKLLPALTLTLGAFVAMLATPGLASADDDEIRILTQNLYVGSNLFQILDPSNPVPVTAAKIFSDVQMTDFHQRAELIADLIAKRRPHLIGLQEASLLRTECPSGIIFPPHDPMPNATDIFSDYRQILLDALAVRGLDYEVVAVVENVDVEVPVLNASGLLPGCAAPFFDVRLTDFDVTLRRGDVAASVVLEKRFVANFPVPTPAGTITFYRGFTVVDATLRDREIRFVNLHLEVDGNPVANFFQFAQANELTQTLDFLATIPGGDKPLIVAGDFNSSPDAFYADCTLPDPITGSVISNGCLTPYGFMAANGYADTWGLRDEDHWNSGFTCCQSDLLTNTKSELSRRVDHIWYRGPLTAVGGPAQLDEVEVKVTGTKKKDRTIDGLWSSDHAGVFAAFEFDDD